MRTTRTRNFKTIQHSPYKREAPMWWILLEVLGDNLLMSCRPFMLEIGNRNFQSHIAIVIPPSSIKLLVNMKIWEESDIPSGVLSKPYCRSATPTNLRNGLISVVEQITWIHRVKLLRIIPWNRFLLNWCVRWEGVKGFISGHNDRIKDISFSELNRATLHQFKPRHLSSCIIYIDVGINSAGLKMFEVWRSQIHSALWYDDYVANQRWLKSRALTYSYTMGLCKGLCAIKKHKE